MSNLCLKEYNYHVLKLKGYNMTSKSQIKVLMAQEDINARQLAELLNKNGDKSYTQGSLLQKISKSSFRYDEMENIAKILGYNIKFEKQN